MKKANKSFAIPYIEARTRNNERMDVVIDYLGERFVVELKTWRGNAYNERGEEQLSTYLDYYHLDKDYMLSYNFNKKRPSACIPFRLEVRRWSKRWCERLFFHDGGASLSHLSRLYHCDTSSENLTNHDNENYILDLHCMNITLPPVCTHTGRRVSLYVQVRFSCP